MKNKKNIIKNFLNQGYSVVDCENLNKLELIKEKLGEQDDEISAINIDLNFAARLAFYPPCFAIPDNIDFENVPTHILIGELDTWTPASACETLVSDLSKHKDNISLTIYENSHHILYLLLF